MLKRKIENPLQAIGNTPLVRLKKIIPDAGFALYAKFEFLNPMGSIKDRIARYMVEKAEKDGRLKNKTMIIENSSGNTALGLAFVCRQKGLKLKVVIRDRTSMEKVNQLKALGTEIHFVNSQLPPEHPDSYNQITPRLAQELPECYFPDQHNNRENNETHYFTTGPEIWKQMEGKIDCFIAGIGTGGTVGGAGKYLKEQNPRLKVIAVDIKGSIFYDYFYQKKITKPHPYLLEGLGDEFLINCADFSVIDQMVQVTDKEAFLTTREIALREGILAGGSSGAVIAALKKIKSEIPAGSRVVTIFPDGGSRYLSTIYNDRWMEENGFLEEPF